MANQMNQPKQGSTSQDQRDSSMKRPEGQTGDQRTSPSTSKPSDDRTSTSRDQSSRSDR